MRPIYVTGIGLWTPGCASVAAWCDGQPDPAATRPPALMLKTRHGRYTSLVTRMAVEVLTQAAAQARADLSNMPTVFGSAYGEIQIAFDQLDMIEQDGVPSPARFKNSVHNTASGHVSIATGSRRFSTAIAAGEGTLAMCLLEAWCWVEQNRESIIVSVADEPLPDHLASVGQYEPLGLALLLSAEPHPSIVLARLDNLRRHDPCDTPEIPTDLARNPCAAGLPLIEAVQRGRSGTIAVQSGAESWSLDLRAGTEAVS